MIASAPNTARNIGICGNGYPVPHRPWKKERHRIEVVRLLMEAYPQSIGIPLHHDGGGACGGKGDTPLIMAARTFKGGMEEEGDGGDFLLDMMNLENGPMGMQVPIPPAVMPQQNVMQQNVMGGGNAEAQEVGLNDAVNVPEAAEVVANEEEVEIGEEEADYEADLASGDDDPKPAAGAGDVTSETVVQENAVPAPEVDDNDQGQLNNDHDNEEDFNPDIEVVRTMIETATRTNNLLAFELSNDDGDTPLHMGKYFSTVQYLDSILSLFHF